MVKSCCVTYCNNNAQNQPQKHYYQIPTDSEKRLSWCKAIKRVATTPNGKPTGKLWVPTTQYVYVCSDHFITGKRSLTTSDPDYVPSVFPQKPKTNQSPKKKTATSAKKFQSPHRQILARNQRRVAYQSRPLRAPMSRKLRLQSPDLEPTSPPPGPSHVNEDNTDVFVEPETCKTMNIADDVENSTSNPSNLHSADQMQSIYEEMNSLRLERDRLKKENEELKQSMASSGLRYLGIKDDEAKCTFLTGLKPNVLASLIEYLKKANTQSQKPTKLSVEDQIVLTMIKLKHNPVFELLALLFDISLTTCIDYFWKWIDLMYVNMRRLIRMQDRDNIFNTIPAHFKCKFPRLTSIIDCFEVFVEAPSSLLARAQFYSQYKKHTTIKVFISCTPLGAINFVSQCYGGRASDIQVVKESGFHTSKYHMPGDQVLADRGFTLVEEFAAGSSSELLIPAFTKGKTQLSAREVEVTHKIASVRIHIERVIGLLRNRYTILKGTIPLRLIKSIKDEKSSSIIANCDKLVVVCSALTNLNGSIIFDKNKPPSKSVLFPDLPCS